MKEQGFFEFGLQLAFLISIFWNARTTWAKNWRGAIFRKSWLLNRRERISMSLFFQRKKLKIVRCRRISRRGLFWHMSKVEKEQKERRREKSPFQVEKHNFQRCQEKASGLWRFPPVPVEETIQSLSFQALFSLSPILLLTFSNWRNSSSVPPFFQAFIQVCSFTKQKKLPKLNVKCFKNWTFPKKKIKIRCDFSR